MLKLGHAPSIHGALHSVGWATSMTVVATVFWSLGRYVIDKDGFAFYGWAFLTCSGLTLGVAAFFFYLAGREWRLAKSQSADAHRPSGETIH